ncbi:SnoaL-like domain protein [Crateriforma conspicua]|uniref:SnoaL-like domain protein n=2 Tax=Planctomycetaceae TaxID=126 RepID=A0A5C6FUS2_9PLAN|nr:SnoaL-like domain protein [Crateriforma conspicua]
MVVGTETLVAMKDAVMKPILLKLMLMLGCVGLGPIAWSDPPSEESAIRQMVKAYVDAYNRHDADAVAQMWSPEAVYTNPHSGEQFVGRDAIRGEFAATFRGSNDLKLSLVTESIEFVSPNVAIEKGAATLSQKGSVSESTRYSAVYVKRDEQWLLDRVTEIVTERPKPSYEGLKELEWLIGSWIDTDDDATVVTTCNWTKNRSFLTRMFSISVGDNVDFAGMQIIGWDAAEKTIRSWVFDSDGGFGQGTWHRQGEAWHIRLVGTLPDGTRSFSTNIMRRVDDDTFTWQAVDRMVAGELLPNVDEIVVKRRDESQ